MDEIIAVEPTPVVRSCVAIRMRIDGFQLKAKSCRVRVDKLDATGNLIDLVDVEITEQEYAAWGQDDQYIIDLVVQKLGMTIVI